MASNLEIAHTSLAAARFTWPMIFEVGDEVTAGPSEQQLYTCLQVHTVCEHRELGKWLSLEYTHLYEAITSATAISSPSWLMKIGCIDSEGAAARTESIVIRRLSARLKAKMMTGMVTSWKKIVGLGVCSTLSTSYGPVDLRALRVHETIR